ncbi:GNAT family N-acetyltransferase [Pseudoalteromonas sp. SG45-5]|uniref:GNAT family N-acetyltransferase n=1 Tax=unclassified Pseudoalteromonas TaxID=194690 RepID=UPI0015F8C402|nr:MULTISPECIES: GNAT family N-acetyltransferase [unclassified Pseudoalteromonas]MBB1384106.1 GNAT family N-acetyltransferase [Pseudoalteromonas sp. SG45-5]MBB1392218.1 GNAT family N-acetyltransferase [Pseudoalteromonas sp. SG44-4]MBB1448044.1 GNAT family N-acetyltransferase [Pseudoalteromonas sp. SG41-6]
MKLTTPMPPEEADFEALKAGLTAFNESFTGIVFREKVSAFVKDDSNKIFGGILGEINWDWMHIQGLWVDASVRKMGWGLKLLSEMEGYALSKGIKNIRLETTTFQALDFYIKAGYSIFGELANMPNGHTSYFLQKQLNV